jgi:chromosome transmission fidelity protein 4
MTDYFGFTMAAMNDKGSIFANAQKGEKNPSTLLYRPFNSWTNNSEVLNTVVVQTTQKYSYCWVL